MERLVIVFVLLFQISNVYAQDSKLYSGVQWGGASFESDELFDSNLKTLGLSLGFMFIENLGVEVRGGVGLGGNEEEFNVEGVDVDVEFKLDRYLSVYFRPELTWGYVNVYGLFGYSQTVFSGSSVLAGTDVEVKVEDGGLSYGAGVGFVNSDDILFNLEMVRLMDEGSYSVNSVYFTVEFPLWQSSNDGF